jgi:hypothetical protein
VPRPVCAHNSLSVTVRLRQINDLARAGLRQARCCAARPECFSPELADRGDDLQYNACAERRLHYMPRFSFSNASENET